MIDPEALVGARGEVREGVAAIANFAELLGSRRVGPRQLPHALPEVQQSCAALVTSFASLEAAMAAHLEDDPEGLAALKMVLAHASDRARELGAELATRGPAPIEAKARLSLEQIVTRIATDLDTVLRLVDLMGAAAVFRSTAIDLREVVAERRPSRRSMLTPVLAVLELRTVPTLSSDARVVLELLEFAVATVVRAGVETPRIIADRGANDALVLTVAESTTEIPIPAEPGMRSPQFNISPRPELPREADVVLAAARRSGVSIEIGSDGGVVKLVFSGR